jgi:hypothetical protein
MANQNDERPSHDPLDYHKGVLGELVLPRMGADGGYYFQCCHCAFVHRLDFTVTPEHGLEMRVYAAPDETEKARAKLEGWLDE